MLHKILLVSGFIASIFGGPVLGSSVFRSIQVGQSPTQGSVLQTDGTFSTWVATSTLGIGGGVPGGNNFDVQYNCTGSLCGSDSFQFNPGSGINLTGGNGISTDASTFLTSGGTIVATGAGSAGDCAQWTSDHSITNISAPCSTVVPAGVSGVYQISDGAGSLSQGIITDDTSQAFVNSRPIAVSTGLINNGNCAYWNFPLADGGGVLSDAGAPCLTSTIFSTHMGFVTSSLSVSNGTIIGSDNGGSVTATTASTNYTLTFANAFMNNPICLAGISSGTPVAFKCVANTTNATFTLSSNLPTSSIFSYIIMGNSR